jgi:hypothetical protein
MQARTDDALSRSPKRAAREQEGVGSRSEGGAASRRVRGDRFESGKEQRKRGTVTLHLPDVERGAGGGSVIGGSGGGNAGDDVNKKMNI